MGNGPQLVFECRTSDFQEMNTDITQDDCVFVIGISQLLSVLHCIVCDVFSKF